MWKVDGFEIRHIQSSGWVIERDGEIVGTFDTLAEVLAHLKQAN